MLKEEAIDILFGCIEAHSEEENEALYMAIEALERERQRQEDIYECQYCFGEVHKNYTYCPFCGERTDGIMLSLAQKPSADRPRGEWIDAEIPLESGDTMPIQVCNLCKTFYPLAYTGGGHRFCPNCGADMRGEDE